MFTHVRQRSNDDQEKSLESIEPDVKMLKGEGSDGESDKMENNNNSPYHHMNTSNKNTPGDKKMSLRYKFQSPKMLGQISLFTSLPLTSIFDRNAEFTRIQPNKGAGKRKKHQYSHRFNLNEFFTYLAEQH